MTIINLDNAEIKFSCPKCRFENKVTLKQIENEEIIICSGCHEKIKLIDKDASTKRSLKNINKSIKDLHMQIKKIK